MQIQKITKQPSFNAKSVITDPQGLLKSEQIGILEGKIEKIGSSSDTFQAMVTSIPGINSIKTLHVIEISTLINKKADKICYYFAEILPNVTNKIKILVTKNGVLKSNDSFEYPLDSKLKQMPLFEFLSEIAEKLAEKHPAN